MIWTSFAIGVAVCLAITLTARVVRERRQRSAFITSLSPAQREGLWGFETVNGDWRAFKELVEFERRKTECDKMLRDERVAQMQILLDEDERAAQLQPSIGNTGAQLGDIRNRTVKSS
jgi:hypothetical protein